MLKFVFWVLVLANGGLFAYQQGYLDPLLGENREPDRLSRQLNADKIKLLSMTAGSSTTKTAASVAKASASATSSSVTTVADITTTTGKKPEVLACTEIGTFSEADARSFEAKLTPLGLGKRLARRTITENLSHIVYIPPQGSKENADKKVAELRRLGITDFFVIQDASPLRWGISLGVFKTEEAAKTRLAELNKQGVRTARLGVRNSINKFAFQLRGMDAATKEKFDKIKAGYPQQTEHACTS